MDAKYLGGAIRDLVTSLVGPKNLDGTRRAPAGDLRIVAADLDRPDTMAAALTVFRLDDRERNPGDPEPGPEELAAWLLRAPPDRRKAAFVATIGDRPVGLALAETASDPGDALQVGAVDVLVVPHHRRQGIGTRLADRAVAALRDMGQTSIVGYPCNELSPEAAKALCAHYDLTPRQDERCSRVLVADVDDDLMDRWIAEGATTAVGYRLVSLVGEIPDDHLEQWCTAAAGMDDAPLDDLEFNFSIRSAEARRAADAAMIDAGWRPFRTLALSADGDPAGMTQLMVHRERPQIAHQGDTAVLPAHRGHRLGRWLKAANYRHLLADVPEVSVIETYNAQSNEHMLAINVAMGFRPHRTYTGWQAPIGDVLARTPPN